MLSHLNEKGLPQMVDVADKAVTVRTATARTTIYLPQPLIPQLRSGDDLLGPKGSVFQTVVVAGVMGAKRTSELIPLCHPLPLEKCEIRCSILSDTEVEVECFVKTTHKTGVEMEALTGASVAALTLYDMCKALSPAIEIRQTVLVAKTGGKADYQRDLGPGAGS